MTWLVVQVVVQFIQVVQLSLGHGLLWVSCMKPLYGVSFVFLQLSNVPVYFCCRGELCNLVCAVKLQRSLRGYFAQVRFCN